MNETQIFVPGLLKSMQKLFLYLFTLLILLSLRHFSQGFDFIRRSNAASVAGYDPHETSWQKFRTVSRFRFVRQADRMRIELFLFDLGVRGDSSILKLITLGNDCEK